MAVETVAKATTLSLLLWGAFGGAAVEVLGWYRLRESLHRDMPGWASDWKYWVATVLMIGVGSLLVLMYQSSFENVKMNPMLAANVGASAPLILSNLLSSAPEVQHVEPRGVPRDGG